MDHHNAAVAEALLNDEGRDGKQREEFERDFFPEDITNDNNRQKTDAPWIYPLIVTFILYWIVAVLAVKDFTLDHPIQLNNNNITCGMDSNVLDKPYQLFLDSRKCYHLSKDGPQDPEEDFNRKFCEEPSICVKECPTTSFNLESCTQPDLSTYRKNIICDNPAILQKITSCGDLAELYRSGRCTNWYVKSKLDGKTCVPESIDESVKEFVKKAYNIRNTTDFYVRDINFQVSSSIWFPIFAALFVTLAFSFVLVRTMRVLAGYIFWGFIITFFALLILAIVGCLILAFTKSDDPQENENRKQIGLIGAGIITTVVLIFGAVAFCFRKKIEIGIELVKEGSRAVCCSTGSIFLPIIPFIIRAFFIIVTGFFVFCVATNLSYEYQVRGVDSRSLENCRCDYNNGDECNPVEFNQKCRANGTICFEVSCAVAMKGFPTTAYIYWGILIFAAMWTVSFIGALVKMIMAHAFGQWYWKYNKEMIPSGTLSEGISRTFNYHMGTAALASLVMTICRILRWLLREKKDSEGGNSAGEVIARILMICFKWIIETILELIKYISDKALVICSVHGTAFWASVKRVSKLFIKDVILVVAVENVSDIVLGVCKFVVAAVATGIAYAFANKSEEYSGSLFFILLGIFIVSYDLCSVLFTSYDVAIDTILVCTLEDWFFTKAQKRYFNSEVLNKLLAEQAQTPAAAV